eukprot:m.744033 g.744033  ORF g.744033 m.744033 type:complete len:120 (-) comp23122_c0_seq9:4979-5338(-)
MSLHDRGLIAASKLYDAHIHMVNVRYISLGKLKAAIIETSFGEADTIDLRVTNAQTNEVYEDDHALVPKNTSVTVLRMPGKGKVTKLPQAKKSMIQPPIYVGSGKSKVRYVPIVYISCS